MIPRRSCGAAHLAKCRDLAWLLFISLAIAPLLLTASANVADPSPRLPVPLITGSLDPEEWSQAARLGLRDFWSQKTHPLEPTEVLLLNTGASLRIKFLCEDRDIRSATDRQHDGETFRDDCVEIFFARPEPRVAEGRGLEINAGGAIADLRAWTPQKLDFSWNSGAALVESLAVDSAVESIRFTLRRVPGLLAHGGRQAAGPGWILEIDFPWIWLRRELGLSETALPYPPEIRANFARWNHGADGKIFTIWSDPGLSVPKPHAPSRYGWLVLEHRSPEN
ncbi:hypothetical protein OpiT1DRAFT_03491 [Opitutaceae bacterium TAV1]|nr:hypothetical protein OpiT1DRAFT_03491 [Opitutaceae bacterium TAV1]